MKKANTSKPAPLYLVQSRVNASGDISTRIFPLTRAVLKINNWYYPAGSGTKQVPVKSLNKIDTSEIKYKNIVKAYSLKKCLASVIEALESKCNSIARTPVAKRNKKESAPAVKEKSAPAPVAAKNNQDTKVKLLVPTKIFSQIDSEDIDAVNAMLSGNKNAFSVIYKRYYPVIRNKYIMSLRFDKDLADDLVEDLFIKVYENIDKYKPEFTFNSWITRVANNFLVDYTRKKGLETVSMSKTVVSDLNPNGEPMEMQLQDTDALTGEEILIESEHKESFKKTFDDIFMTLDKKSRDVINMYYTENKSYKEIEDKTGLSISNIKVTLFRAKAKLKEAVTSNPKMMALITN